MIKEIKGYHVLIGLLIFFGVIIAVNAVFLTQALTTFRGEDERRSYMQGNNYNAVLDRRAAQAELGWTATSEVRSDGVTLDIDQAGGQPVSGLVMEARLRHPADSNLDIELSLTETDAGIYRAVTAIPQGRWTLAVGTAEGPPFELEQDVWLQ
ncbi:FixH family protein [Hyphobacterium sp.]|uniref:FixH family protein n=1 Tax=Hyphobacterium sp. TaxID=2004662 RepID=UPI003BA921FD